jgi:hypothetical protein
LRSYFVEFFVIDGVVTESCENHELVCEVLSELDKREWVLDFSCPFPDDSFRVELKGDNWEILGLGRGDKDLAILVFAVGGHFKEVSKFL